VESFVGSGGTNWDPSGLLQTPFDISPDDYQALDARCSPLLTPSSCHDPLFLTVECINAELAVVYPGGIPDEFTDELFDNPDAIGEVCLING
jgi:hypothetical protein